jgi:ABC-2 type transport system permease protein
MLAKTSGAIVFGLFNAIVPVLFASFMVNLSGIQWLPVFGAVFLISVTSTLLGLFIAVSVKEVFEAQTFSNFFRFPMIFLCGLFIPVQALPLFLRPLSYILPLTYGADILKSSINQSGYMGLPLNFVILLGFSVALFALSMRNVKRKWIY